MKQDRSLLEQNLIRPTSEIKSKRKIVKDIKSYLSDNHSVFEGSVQTWINDVKNLKGVDTRLLFLFAEQVYLKTGNQEINPENFFTPSEIKASRQYSGKMYIKDEVEFPLQYKNVLEVTRDSWVFMMHIRDIVDLYNSRKLNWNPESQREATYKKVDNQIIETATIYQQNVNEMVQLLKENKLETTQIILNCSLGTSGLNEDVEYDKETQELVIHDCKIDIIDGMHRILASERALRQNPDLDFKFQVKVLNVSVPRAAEYLAQISRQTPISKTKRRIMGKETDADLVVSDLMEKSVLRDRVSKKEMLTKSRKELVTYNSLVNAIESNFDLEKKVERYEVIDYLKEAFDVLLSYYDNEFNIEYEKYKKESLINDNNIICNGFVTLLGRMKKNDIEARHIRKYIKDINFSKDNPIWKQEDILDENNNLTKNAKQNIENYFKGIEI